MVKYIGCIGIKGLDYLKMYKVFTEEKMKEIDAEVALFFKDNGFSLKANFDIINTCTQLGFKMISLDLPKGIDGVIAVGKGSKLIGLSNRVTPLESRFVVAHELAHYIYESRGKKEEDILFAMKDSILHDEQKSEIEDLMDFMAAAILVPKDLFLEDLRKLDLSKVFKIDEVHNIEIGKIEKLSKQYNVDPKMIMRRIFEVSCYVG